MVKVFLDYLGAIIGSVGKVSYYMRYSDNIARRKGTERKASDSPAAVEQRGKFGAIVKLSTVLQPASALGFPQRKRGLSATNAFHQVNKDICTVESNTIMIDYEHLLCSNGSLITPNVTVNYAADTKKYLFEQEEMAEEVNCNADDLVYAVLLESKAGYCRLIELRKRGESGSTSAALPNTWNKEYVFVYVFAVSADKKKASKSLYLTVGEGS